MREESCELLADVLGKSSLRRREVVESAAVGYLISANDKGKVDASDMDKLIVPTRPRHCH